MFISLDKAKLLFAEGILQRARILESQSLLIKGNYEILLDNGRETYSLATQREGMIPKSYAVVDTAVEDLKRIGFEAKQIIIK